MKRLGLVLCLFLGGCASATTEYYEAVTAAAKANAVASQAKFDALSAIAAAGDGQAASAAVMALALTKTPTITPVPQQSQSIQWASILAAPITSLGMAWVQSDASKSIAKYNADVSLARVQATAQGNAALYGAFADMNQGAVDLGVAGLEAAGSTPDYSDFIDGMVTLGTAGITGAVDLGTAGFGANVDIATAGVDGLVELGGAGITGVTSVSLDAFDTLLNLDTGNNSLLEGVWENYTTSIEQIVSDIPRVCQATTNEDGELVLVCN